MLSVRINHGKTEQKKKFYTAPSYIISISRRSFQMGGLHHAYHALAASESLLLLAGQVGVEAAFQEKSSKTTDNGVQQTVNLAVHLVVFLIHLGVHLIELRIHPVAEVFDLCFHLSLAHSEVTDLQFRSGDILTRYQHDISYPKTPPSVPFPVEKSDPR
jgi:hypothetical protein